eukprot:Ihof_evm7s50 gene=Ihof_evmTU7s50
MPSARQNEMPKAINTANIALVRELLEDGVSVEFRYREQQTALHIAAARGLSDIVELLLSFGARADAQDMGGHTPKQLARHYGHTGSMELLERKGRQMGQLPSPSLTNQMANLNLSCAKEVANTTVCSQNGVDHARVGEIVQGTTGREVIWIDDAGQLLCDAVQHMSQCPVLGLDAEGFSATGPALLQLAAIGEDTVNPTRHQGTIYVYLFDLLSPAHRTIMNALHPILQSPSILKVIHDLHQDACQLHMAYGTIMQGLFDTQLSNEFLTGDVFGGMGGVVEKFSGVNHTSKKNTQNAMKNDPELFVRRPLDAALQRYAADDVALLLAAFGNMWTTLGPTYAFAIVNASQERCERASNSLESTANKRVVAFRGPKRILCSQELIYHTPNLGAFLPGPLNVHAVADDLIALVAPIFQPFHPKMQMKVQKAVPTPTDPKPFLREVVMEMGKPPYAVFYSTDNTTEKVPLQEDITSVCSLQQMGNVLSCLDPFGQEGTVHIPGTLHRICRSNRGNANDRAACTITMHVGRPIIGLADTLVDYLYNPRKSMLVVGPIGSGKTALLRDIARILSSKSEHVYVIDTKNEIGGHFQTIHPSLGKAKRILAPPSQGDLINNLLQTAPTEAIVVDEILSLTEARAVAFAKTRRCQMIAGVQGSFRSLVANQELNGILGGIGPSTPDEMARGQP